MNCTECRELLESGEQTEEAMEHCATCADCSGVLAEDRLFAAYADGIVVPELWEGVQRRIAEETRPIPFFRRRRVVWLAAAAAAVIALVSFLPRMETVPVERAAVPSPAVTAAKRYETAIASLEAQLRTAAPARQREAQSLLPELTNAISHAERAARRSPDDPATVSFLISAYDTKLEYLIGVVHDQS